MNAVNLFTAEKLVETIAKQICETSGQEYSEKLRSRVEVKLKRRFIELNLQTLAEYAAYYHLHEKAELKHLTTAMTTQASHFFSEFSHFEYISDFVLKQLVPEIRKRNDKTLNVWSTACSRGHEAYSLAMYLKQALNLYGTDLQVRVIGTDSELDAIKFAQAGVFPRGEMRDVPMQFLGNDWERVSISGVDMMRAKPALKRMVHFEYANLLGLKAKFPGQKFDLIFTRNVFSYFNESEIKESCLELLTRMHLTGQLFVGLSESLQGLGLPLEYRGPSVYGFARPAEAVSPRSSFGIPKAIEKDLIKVFCIDDSPAVHTLMRSILKKENGFLISGSAMSLAEAQRQSKVLCDSDLVTVDFQTNEENSLLYLEKNLKDWHPPALVITSEVKDQTKLIEAATKLGEFEFVERPMLNHLSEQGQIIRAKLHTLFMSRRNNVLQFRGQDQFKNCVPISNPSEKVRVLIGGMSHLKKISSYLRDLKGDQPPVYLFFEGMNRNLSVLASEIKRLSGKNCVHGRDFSEGAKPNEIRVYDFRNFFAKVATFHREHHTSIGILGDMGPSSSELVLTWAHAHLILEDIGQGEGAEFLKAHVQDIFPASSFAFLSSERLQDE